jgi:hypothetical protein
MKTEMRITFFYRTGKRCHQLGQDFKALSLNSQTASVRFVISLHPSACPHTSARLSQDGLSYNLVLETSTKICGET